MPRNPRPEDIPLAIVGMACKLPGADDLEEYWKLLIEGRSAVVDLPPDRLDQSLYYDPKVGVLGKSYSKRGALISSRDFNHAACPIPEKLRRSVDPAHLLMCEVAGAALQHGGMDPFDLPESLRNCGVFIGHAQGSNLGGDSTYALNIEEAAEFLRESEQFRELPEADQQAVMEELVSDVRNRMPCAALERPDISASMVAGTINKAFHLSGPFAAINSACASSLQSVLVGARALQLGRVEMAIVGGASDCKSDSLVLFSHARAMSSTDSRPFDADADGLICGEGYAAVVLKTLSRALADGDQIHAVLRGLGISSDGKGKSLWAPRKEGQIEAMKRAYRSGVDISKLQYLEAHSTATQVGDATELNTLTEILSEHFPPGKKIPVTSVKANIGHSLETAGIASVIKTVLCMQHQMIPPAINIRQLNQKIDWDQAPIFVPTSQVPWPAPADGTPRLAGINAFGIGGLNMHAVLEEFNAASHVASPPIVNGSQETADQDAIAVVGMGCVLPGAASVDEYRQLLFSGADPKCPAPADRLRYDLLPHAHGANGTPPLGGFVLGFEYDWRRHKVPPKQIAQADPLQFMLLEAADQALNDAGYDHRPLDRSRVGVVVGTEFGGDFSFQLQMGLRLPEMRRTVERSLNSRQVDPEQIKRVTDQFSQALLQRWPALVDETGSFSTSSLASRIGKTWNLMGGAAALDAGEASSLVAVGMSVDLLLSGDCDMMICAAGQRRMGLPAYESFALGGSSAEMRSPLDARGEGLVPGEGVGVVLLKRLSDARRDGDSVRAIIKGFGAAHHQTWQAAVRLAMERSFQSGDATADRVAVIELDAVSRDMADEQLQAISDLHEGCPRKNPLLVGSAASQTGFAQGASGMVSLLKAVLELEQGRVPATLGVEVPAVAATRRPDTLHIATDQMMVPNSHPDGNPLAAVVSCGRGMAYHLLCEADRAPNPEPESTASAPQQAAGAPIPSVASPSPNQTPELESFLINFVVEQTGYPAEVVELDADLEADLGIDSIKKAQLFGELQEYFDVTPSDDLTLDDFPTLRHVMNFLAGANSAATTAPSATSAATNGVVGHAPPTVAASPTEWQIIRFGAESLDDLRSQIANALTDCRHCYATSPPSFDPRHHVRLTIVADNPGTLEKRLQLLTSRPHYETLRPTLARQGVFLCESISVTRPRIAFFFPGQGSQYDGMLRDLVDVYPAAAEAMREADAALVQLGSPTFAEMAWTTPNQLGRDAWATQASMMVADHIVHSVLRAENILPDLVAGHSYGEYCALLAAGAWSVAEALRVTRARCDGIDACRSAQGGLLATTATPDQARQLFENLNGAVHIATHNAPQQTVVGGDLESLEEVARRLSASGLQARKLSVPCPFHTPLMANSCGPLREALATADLRRPSVTTFSLVTNEEIGGPDEIRANLEAHMTRPQRYVDLVRMLADERPTVFVEVGPQQHLTRLNEQILSGMEAHLIASDSPKGSVLEQVCRVRALLECCGALDQPTEAAATVARQAAPGQVVHFDATERRRERVRRAAGAEQDVVASPIVIHSNSDQSADPHANVHDDAIVPASRVAASWPEPDGGATAEQPAPQVSTPTTPAVDGAELETFLINFVVEQTGYPAEVVELDADLEADLGIDSIKKAQLFGELQEYFDVTPSDDLTLDDFPTLRHVVNYLAANTASPPTMDAVAEVEAPAADTWEPNTVVAAPEPTRADSPLTVAEAPVRTLTLTGAAQEMGRTHGQELAAEIRRGLYRLADLAYGQSEAHPSLLAHAAAPERLFTAAELDELGGIADAVGVPVANLIAFNLTVMAGLGRASAQLAVEADGGRALRHGMRDELSLNSALVDSLTPVVQRRRPDQGHESLTVTFAGCVGFVAGLNANGLAVTSGALLDASSDASPEKAPCHTLLTRRVLEQASDTASALEILQQAPGAAPWNMVLTSVGCRPTCVEFDGQSLNTRQDTTVLAANHRELSAASGSPQPSVDRLKRLQQFLTGSTYAVNELQTALSTFGVKSTRQLSVLIDHSRGELAVSAGSTDAATEPDFCSFYLGDSLAVEVAPTAPSSDAQEKVDPALYDLDDEKDHNLTERFVMRIVESPWPHDAPHVPKLEGAALVIGDNPAAEALTEQLQTLGATVHRFALSGSYESAIEQLEQLCREQPVAHLFLMSARDDDRDAKPWDHIYETQVLAPYFLCQRWVQLASAGKWLDKCTVMAVTNCSGDFGFSGNVATPETGALTGLMKSLVLEVNVMSGHRHFSAKAIDVPPGEPPHLLARFMCRELAARTRDYEIAYVDGTRYLQVAIPRAAEPQQLPATIPQGNWVITGGARGITAECARELGKRFGIKLHLIGSSGRPQIDPAWRDLDEAGLSRLRSETVLQARTAGENPAKALARVNKQIEIDRTLSNFAAEGLQAYYYSCDVSDRVALGHVVDEIRREHGPIEGVLHGAGIERSCRFEKKQTDDVRATFGAKVLGAWHLMALTETDPVRHFIGFGSISGRMGSNGQTDYCAASDMLCKLISWYGQRHESCHAVGFHWHPWDEIGMASRPEARSMLHASGLKLMPKREGLRHFLRELYAGPTECELLITERAYHQRYYPGNVDELASDFASGKTVEFPHRSPRQVASRHVLRMKRAPLATDAVHAVALPSRALLLGDNRDAHALREQLIACGVDVQMLPLAEDHESVVEQLEKLWQSHPARALFLMTGRGGETFQLDANDPLRAARLAFKVTQRWFQLVSEVASAEPATLVAATALGGEFGFRGRVDLPEGGALSGLLKSVYVEDARFEHRRFRVKLIDSPGDESPQDLAAAICSELTHGGPEVEVSWSRGNRQTVECAAAPAERLTLRDVPRGGTWVVTGGGRGITAYAARRLARRYGLKLHLVGKSSLPSADVPWLHCSEAELKPFKTAIVREAVAAGRSPEEAWDKVRKGREISREIAKYEEAGVEATYHSCDLTDEAALSTVLETIRRTDGPIEGILHGAGYAKAARFENRVGNSLERTFGPKVDGAVALMRLTRGDPLRYFLAFGSLSGRYGGNGLSIYASANDMLAKLCGWFRNQRPECATTCFHWQTWDRIGMAMIADAVDITKSSFKMDFLQPEEGFEHFHREITAGAPEAEVLIADGFFERSFYSYPVTCQRADDVPPTTPARSLPLIDTIDVDPTGSSGVAGITFDPTQDPFLMEHRLKQKPFLPGVVGIEAVLEAAAMFQPDQTIHGVSDVEIVNGLMFPSDVPIATRVEVTRDGEMLESRLVSELRNRAGQIIDPQRLHVRAVVNSVGEPPRLEATSPGEPPLGWVPFVYPDDGLLYHGPPLRCLRQFAFQYDGGWGQIVAPPLAELAGQRAGKGWIIPAAVLDACVVCCGSFIFLQFGGELEVPHGLQHLCWTRQPHPGEPCIARFYFRSRERHHSKFDFTLFGEDDQPILQALGYRTIRVGGERP